jgi:hypothetical protein
LKQNISKRKKELLDNIDNQASMLGFKVQPKNSKTRLFLDEMADKPERPDTFEPISKQVYINEGMVFHRNFDGKLECFGTVTDWCTKLAKELTERGKNDQT